MIVDKNNTNMQKKTNEILIIKNQEDIKEMPEKEKSQLAYDILKEIKL